MTDEKIVKNKGWNNLIPYKKGDTSGKSEAGKLGGKASGESKRRMKTFKEELMAILQEELVNSKGEKITVQENINRALLVRAGKGDTKAYVIIRDTLGQKPVDESKVVVENAGDVKINLDLVKDMEKHFNETDK